MVFKRPVQRYGQMPVAETPWQRAGQLWDERIGSARVQAHNWRRMAFGMLALSCGLSCGLVWQSLQSRVVPYVVAVDHLGEARAVTPADRAYQPTDSQVAWFLGHFITAVRARTLDPVLMRESWLQAYDFVSPRGAIFLGDYARSADPFANVGEKTVSVTVTSVVRASASSFQVKWIENAYDRGAPAGFSHWTAMLTVTMKAPASAEILRRNPLGLYIDAIDWSRELEVPGEKQPADATAARASQPGSETNIPAFTQPQMENHS
ncbi:conjugal transfer protein TrbF [Novosphingobium terrae]|uniref:conjugal transfer protein TrbF n=1 Tax=Novosphingobium terrae TaxID=2726189 RepID=UPI0019807DB9|nr:conjugal transfer protein TrbF [Novosphingobium terrae]